MGKATKPRAKPAKRITAAPAPPRAIDGASRPRDRATPITDAQLDLDANADVEAAKDASGKMVRAQRKDVFGLLYARQGLTETQYLACRRLAADMIERAGLGDRITAGGASDPSRRALVTDRGIAAGQRIDWLFGKASPAFHVLGEARDGQTAPPPRILSPMDCRLLDELIEPKRIVGPIKGRWRVQVRLVAGVSEVARQTEIIRRAADRLARSYLEWDNRPQAVDRKSRAHATA